MVNIAPPSAYARMAILSVEKVFDVPGLIAAGLSESPELLRSRFSEVGVGMCRDGGSGLFAGIIITADPDLLRGKQTPGLSGRLTPAVALERLLAGTGLRGQAGPGGTYSLSPQPASVRPATREQEAAGDVAEIVVVGVLTDIAIDQQEIEMRQASDLSDLFRQVPSVSVGGGR